MHPTEAKFPIQTEAFKKLIEEMYQVHLNKNQDYSPSNILYTGEIGVLVRIWDKFCRLCSLNGAPFPNIHSQIEELAYDVNNCDVKKDEILEVLHNIIESSVFPPRDYDKIDQVISKNEPIEDSWLDMAVYSIIGYLVHKKCWGR